MKQSVKAVFFDIDGTLVSFNTHQIPQSTLNAVSELRRKGIKVYIATGRPLQFIDNLGDLEYDGMITVTGAHCFTREGQVIYHHPVMEDDVRRIVDFQKKEVGAYPIIFVVEDELFVTDINDDVRFIADLLNIRLPQIRPADYALGKPVLQIISFFKSDREDGLMKELMPHCVSMRWHPLFTDVIASGVSKSIGIDKVLAYEGISLDEAMAFGDGGNDLSMVKHVPFGIAMGNACEELKAVANYVTDDVDHDGIAKALLHYGLIDHI